MYFFFYGGHSTTKAGSGDHFIMEVTVTLYEGMASFTSMPYPGFEPSTFAVAVGCPIHYTSWSAFASVTVLYSEYRFSLNLFY